MGNEQVFCVLEGRKQGRRQRKGKMLPTGETDPSSLEFKLHVEAQLGFVRLHEHCANALHDCTIPSYRIVSKAEENLLLYSYCCNQEKASRLRLPCGRNPYKSIHLEEYTCVTTSKPQKLG